MEQVAGKFDRSGDDLDQMLSQLLNQLEVLQTAWKGRGGSSFTQVREAYQANQKKLRQALGETAQAIRTSGTNYTAVDDEASGKVGSINTSINLAL